MYGDIVQVLTSDKLFIHGFYSNAVGKTAVLHIHGYEGNFYENYFLHPLYKKLREQNISFLSANTRGNGKITDFNTVSGSIITVGAWNERLEDTYLDIDAWIKFLLTNGYENIILQGHSLGTVKAVRYLFEGTHRKKIKKLILLSPFDAKGLFQHYETKSLESCISIAKREIKKGNTMNNAKLKSWSGMSYQTFMSMYGGDELSRMFEFCNDSYEFSALKKITIPTLIMVGSKDEYFHLSNPNHPEEATDILKKNIPKNKTILLPQANHWFNGFEDQLASEVLSFITA